MPPERRRPTEPRHRQDAWRRRRSRGWDVDPEAPASVPDPSDVEIAEDFGAPDLAPDLAALARELSAAGSRARARAIRDDRAAPDPAFAAALRAGLIAPATAAAVALPAGPGPAAPVPSAAAATATRGAAARRFEGVGAPRWTALVAVALLAVTALGLPAGRLGSGSPQAHLSAAGGTSISHLGTVRPASDGATIEAGDVISVGPGGGAVLVLGRSEARLAAGASIQVDRLGSDQIALVQLAGRAYHRVDLAPGATYVVRTGSITWTAHGTAFDIDRASAARGDAITVLSVEHTLTFQGPELSGSLLEGRRAVVQLAGDTPDVAVTSVDPAELADGWLAENARRDLAAGWSAGILTGIAAR